jgi:protein-tyrosine-phosphatase
MKNKKEEYRIRSISVTKEMDKKIDEIQKKVLKEHGIKLNFNNTIAYLVKDYKL